MNITFDSSALLGIETGGARYARQLTEHIILKYPENNYSCLYYVFRNEARNIYLSKLKNRELAANIKNVPVYLPRTMLEYIWSFAPCLLPIERLAGSSGIFHSLSYVAPYSSKMPVVATVYDLGLIKHPEHDSGRAKIFYSTMKKTIKWADHFIAISENTKKDLIDVLGVPESKITVTYPGNSIKLTDPVDLNGERLVLDKYSITRPYILFVGTIGANKNIDTLIRAYHIAKTRHKIKQNLVICGKKTRIYPVLKELAEKLGVACNINFTGFVPDDELPYLYGGADIFTYISMYEGFGIPVLEAMACGCPVIASNTSSIPEIVGDAGILVNPGDIDAIAGAISAILSDEGTRTALKSAARERSKLFSYDKCAEETLNVYRKLA